MDLHAAASPAASCPTSPFAEDTRSGDAQRAALTRPPEGPRALGFSLRPPPHLLPPPSTWGARTAWRGPPTKDTANLS